MPPNPASVWALAGSLHEVTPPLARGPIRRATPEAVQTLEAVQMLEAVHRIKPWSPEAVQTLEALESAVS